MTSIQGYIRNTIGDDLGNVNLTFFNRNTGDTKVLKSQAKGGFSTDLAPGPYVWVAIQDGYSPKTSSLDIPADNMLIDIPTIVLQESAEVTSPPVLSPPNVYTGLDVDFLAQHDDPRFSIEAPISIMEANQAVDLFSVVNIMLAGSNERAVGGENRTDMFGMLTLYYGLQDKSLSNQLVVQNVERLWQNIDSELQILAERLDSMQVDVNFLRREAKRQFNLGVNNTVVGNVAFPVLFRRYVEIGRDPRLSIDVKAARDSEFFDKVKLEETYALLRELKDVIIQCVRSLSKYGTAATRRVNGDWSAFQAQALEILDRVARERVSDDADEMTPWAVLAILTGRNREEFLPYVSLYRHGYKLLRYAVNIYNETHGCLTNTDRDHLEALFQPQGKEYWTTRIRREAEVVNRYPLSAWG